MVIQVNCHLEAEPLLVQAKNYTNFATMEFQTQNNGSVTFYVRTAEDAINILSAAIDLAKIVSDAPYETDKVKD